MSHNRIMSIWKPYSWANALIEQKSLKVIDLLALRVCAREKLGVGSRNVTILIRVAHIDSSGQ